jgi:hypothetical protein
MWLQLWIGVVHHLPADLSAVFASCFAAPLLQIMAEAGAQSAMVDAKKGRVVAALFKEPGAAGPAWFRARIDGKAKAPDSGAPLT